ncbi:MAG: hypothetical protein RL885_24895 [Planctomycetota bacterium]
MKLQATKLKITNVLHTKDLEIELGAVTVLEGANGQGKTAVLSALRAAIGGGHDATLIRNGEKAGEVVLEFEDGSCLTDRITPSGSKRTFTDADGVAVRKTQSHLDAIRDALSLNPIEFIDAPAKRRIELLAAAVPAEMSRDRIEEAAGCPLPRGCTIQGSALEAIGAAESAYYEARRDVNAELRQARETVASLEGSIPEGAEDPKRIEEEIAQKDADVARLEREAKADEEGATAKARAREEEAREQMEEIIAQARHDFEEIVREAREDAERSRKAIEEKFHPRINSARSERATLVERFKAANQATGTLEVLDRSRKTAAEKGVLAERLDQAVKAVRKLREEILEDLPIKGLEVREGEIFFEDVAWPHLEESRRVWLSVQIAQLRSGELGLLCVDGLERLDGDRFAQFCEQLLESGAQLIGARVTDGDLAITYPGEGE